jgi:hypothetical protein
MKTFAGFWRDGAVVKPEKEHLNWANGVFIIDKRFGAFDVAIKGFSDWDDVYWLDTTTPEELTPQEAFELLTVISPTTNYIEPKFDCEWIKAEPFKPIINWNKMTEYPPKQRWRVPTDADRFSEKCRVRHSENQDWQQNHGRFICYDPYSDTYLLIHQDGKWTSWTFCEVLDE